MSQRSKWFTQEYLNWIIIGLMYITYILPVLFPFSPPLTIGEKATRFYNIVESLPEEPYILMAYDYSPVSYPLFQGLQEAFMKHIYSKNGRVICVAFSADGAMMYQKMEITFGYVWNTKTYGEDYVFLGYIPGGETGLASFLSSIRSVIATDFRGNLIDDLPIMKNIDTCTDFDLVIDCETGTTLGDGFVRQVSTVYKTTLAIACSGGATLEPYYPDQLQANLYPLPQVGAEYETLIKEPGNASAQLGVLFLGALYFILLFIFGNIARIFKRG